jgi:hypothetical protein
MFEPPPEPVPFSLPYTGARLAWALECIGWSKNYFGERLDLDHGTVRQMLNGRRFIPDILGIWVESLAQTHITFPKPFSWRPKPGAEPDRFGYDLAKRCDNTDTIVVDNEPV